MRYLPGPNLPSSGARRSKNLPRTHAPPSARNPKAPVPAQTQPSREQHSGPLRSRRMHGVTPADVTASSGKQPSGRHYEMRLLPDTTNHDAGGSDARAGTKASLDPRVAAHLLLARCRCFAYASSSASWALPDNPDVARVVVDCGGIRKAGLCSTRSRVGRGPRGWRLNTPCTARRRAHMLAAGIDLQALSRSGIVLVHDGEIQRFSALGRYDVLDTPGRRASDRRMTRGGCDGSRGV